MLRMTKYIALFIVLTIAADQYIKALVLKWYPEKVLYNPGAAFSLGKESPELVVVITVIALAVLFAFILRLGTPTFRRGIRWRSARIIISLSLIFAGALSNLLDRLWRGGVMDYCHLSFWPSFNFADVIIVLGCLLLLVFYLFGKHPDHPKLE